MSDESSINTQNGSVSHVATDAHHRGSAGQASETVARIGSGLPAMSADVLSLSSLYSTSGDAFEMLFLRYYPHVHRVLFRLVGDEADDLAQEVFLRLYSRPPKADSDVGAWLYRVAVNLGYNALRAMRRWQPLRSISPSAERDAGNGELATPVDASQMLWQQSAPDPEAWTEQREQVRLVHKALGGLNRKQATLLALRYDGLSYAEIARVLDISPGSVGTLLARAERAFERVYVELSDRLGSKG